MKKKMDIILITIFVVLVLIGAYMFLIKPEQKSGETDAIKLYCIESLIKTKKMFLCIKQVKKL